MPRIILLGARNPYKASERKIYNSKKFSLL